MLSKIAFYEEVAFDQDGRDVGVKGLEVGKG
jgi:hypothetical protein